jgi:DNA topoisomerase-1
VSNVGGVFVPKDPAFEARHPRDRSGRDRGQFIDVIGLMNGLGAHFDSDQGAWMVPKDRSEDLKQAQKDMGFEMMSVPKGMRPLRSRGALASETDLETGAPDPRIAADAQIEKRLAIPPAWTDVMVLANLDNPGDAKALAIGRDEKGRRQTIRNPLAAEQASADKFERIRRLDERIDAVDNRLIEDAPSDDTAAAMLLVRRMGLRPGSTKNTGADQWAYGASTLERRHVRVEGDVVHLAFDSKKGGHTVLNHEDPELAAALRIRLRGKAGGDQIFPKTNERKMNSWVKQIAGDDFTVKDFRTHLGTSVAAALVMDSPEPMTAKEHRQLQLRVADQVSHVLGNDRNEALKSYIDPAVFGPAPGTSADLKKSEVPGHTGRQMLKDAFDAGFHEGDDLGGNVGSDMVKRVTLSDGSAGVLKRPKPDQHRREYISGVAANAMGFDVHTIDAGEGRLLTSMVSGSPGGKKASLQDLRAHVTAPGGREIGVLDWLTRNRDRHGGNWIVTENGVVPIDHGLTNFGPADNDRDIPRGVFAEHWLGLTQKPTAYAGADKDATQALTAKNPKAKLQPKVSKRYLDDVRRRLEQAREEFSDVEWDGMMERLRILQAAAPDLIDGEEPLR